MDIKELESFRLSDAVKFHDNLNPALWTEKGKLDPEVKEQLLTIAKDFMAELGINSLKVEDITISGSNAAYTYTPHSDLDLHILVDFDKLPDDEVYQELFTAKKTLYNDTHDIKVHGVPVELYVQDSNKPVVSLGEYSLLKNEWIKIPKKGKANFDQNATKAKYEKLGNMVELALRTSNLKRIEKVLDIIKRYRKAGLDSTGEFGPENLAFKALRSQGYIKKLYDLKNDLHSKELSIEDYHPNAKPRGPEFPPTMPKGTIRVDVSDVYDWYKLGQHISNMKGLGKHDFGKGPPSTILSFGDEDLEHKYIDALQKTGLDTTDIDPKAHDMKKGQKVDPTYNVNEILDTQPGKSNKAKWDFSDPDMQELNFTASNGQQYKLDFLAPYIGPDEINQYNLLPDASDKYLDRGFFVQFEQVNKRSPWKKGKQGIEGTGAAAEIFGIVSNAILQFVKKKKPTYLYFQAAESNRVRLYSAMIKRLLPSLPGWKSQGPSSDGVFTLYSPIKKVTKEASGYIPSEKEKNDPRFKTALTVDVKPDSIKKNAKAFGFKVDRTGRPPLLRK